MAPQQQRAENRNHRMCDEVDGNHIEDQVAARGIKAKSLAGEIGQGRAGVHALIPAWKRIGERAFDYRWTDYGAGQVMACGKDQLLTEALAVAVRIRPSPFESAV